MAAPAGRPGPHRARVTPAMIPVPPCVASPAALAGGQSGRSGIPCPASLLMRRRSRVQSLPHGLELSFEARDAPLQDVGIDRPGSRRTSPRERDHEGGHGGEESDAGECSVHDRSRTKCMLRRRTQFPAGGPRCQRGAWVRGSRPPSPGEARTPPPRPSPHCASRAPCGSGIIGGCPPKAEGPEGLPEGLGQGFHQNSRSRSFRRLRVRSPVSICLLVNSWLVS